MSPYVCTIQSKQTVGWCPDKNKDHTSVHLASDWCVHDVYTTNLHREHKRLGKTRGRRREHFYSISVYKSLKGFVFLLSNNTPYWKYMLKTGDVQCDLVAGMRYVLQVIYKWFTRYLQVINNQVIFKWFTSELPLTEWLTFRSVRIIRNWK